MAAPPLWADATQARMTPVVRAVLSARPSVVNIQGQKTVNETTPTGGESHRQVNGMGTGVVIDERGYILTNAHVVEGVRQINVKFDDGRTFVATPVAADKTTDLAVILVRTGRGLPVISIGSSSDIMTGESVIAVGNAYGYEHTVTQGIVSSQHRDVQVSDTQAYEDLIQTDASINPGNSGGPLLNLDGEMVGVNVAVRAGAQGIGFAIPIDKAMQVAAELMSVQQIEGFAHGLVTTTETVSGGRVVVRRVEPGSPAASSQLEPGDVVVRVGDVDTHRALDIERALLGKRTGATVPVEVLRAGERIDFALRIGPQRAAVASVASAQEPAEASPWQVFGMELREEPRATFARGGLQYSGGMRVLDVRPGSPAQMQGIRQGDILVGMNNLETASERDVSYFVYEANAGRLDGIRFRILRGGRAFQGDLNLAATRTASGSATRR